MLLSEKRFEMSELFHTNSDKWPNVKILNNNPGQVYNVNTSCFTINGAKLSAYKKTKLHI